METPTIEVHGGTLHLPSEVKSALNLDEDSRLSWTILDGALILKPVETRPLDREAAWKALKEIQLLCSSSGPSLEDSLYELRRQDEENRKRKFG